MTTQAQDPLPADLIAELPPLFAPDPRGIQADRELANDLASLSVLFDSDPLQLDREQCRLLWSVVKLDDARFTPVDALSLCKWSPGQLFVLELLDDGFLVRPCEDPEAGWATWVELTLDKRGRLTLPPAARKHLGVGLQDRVIIGTDPNHAGTFFLIAPTVIEKRLSLRYDS